MYVLRTLLPLKRFASQSGKAAEDSTRGSSQLGNGSLFCTPYVERHVVIMYLAEGDLIQSLETRPCVLYVCNKVVITDEAIRNTLLDP